MRISDWSSDVFSSDLLLLESRVNLKFLLERGQQLLPTFAPVAAFLKLLEHVLGLLVILLQRIVDIHRFLRVAAHRSVFRSEERRVGKGWDRTCRYRWSPYH